MAEGKPLGLDELERRCQAATPGPWGASAFTVDATNGWGDAVDVDVQRLYDAGEEGDAYVAERGVIADVYGLERFAAPNAAFIAAARTDVPALIARVRELETALRVYADRKNWGSTIDMGSEVSDGGLMDVMDFQPDTLEPWSIAQDALGVPSVEEGTA